MATFGTRLMTWWKGQLVGQDQFGNRYYREKTGGRRWVIYRGMAEASKVPAEWHVWLHRTTDEPPDGKAEAKPWEKQHVPNLSGTSVAYRPLGSLVQGGLRPPATGDYEAWRPD